MEAFKRVITFILSLLFILVSFPVSVQAGTPRIPNSIEIGVGGTKTIPCDLSNCYGTRKNWSATGRHISVSRGGTVKALSIGTGDVIVSTNVQSETARCKVIVKPAAHVKLNKSNLKLKRNESSKLVSSFSPSGCSRKAEWSSSNSSVASVSRNGQVLAKNIGSCTITCKSEDGTGHEDSCRVEVIRSITATKKSTTKKKSTKNKSKKPKKSNSSNSNKSSEKEQTATTRKSLHESQDIAYISEEEIENEEKNSGSESGTTTQTTTTIVYKIDEDTGETTSAVYQEDDLSQLAEDNDTTDNSYESYIVQDYKLKSISKKGKPIQISWKKLNGVSGYELYSSTDRKTFSLIYDGKTNEYKQHHYKYGKTYYYILKSYRMNNGIKVYDMPSNILQQKAVKNGVFSMFSKEADISEDK